MCILLDVMKLKIQPLIERALTTQYYSNLWAKSSHQNLTELPLSDKSLFSSKDSAQSLAVDANDISYFYFSAGTTGNPKMIPFTVQEWEKRAKYRGACYANLVGLESPNKVAVLLPFGPWVAGPSAQTALLQFGCTVFPIGLLSEDEEMVGLFSIFERHKIDTLVTAPSFVQRLAYLYNKEENKPKLQIKKVVTSGEFITDSLRQKVMETFGAHIFTSYASSESFIGCECEAHSGFHYDPNEVFIETLDDNGGATHEYGTVTITVLRSEAVPIIRYPMGDLGKIDTTPCSCGSNLPRLIWGGRGHEIFEVAGGVNVYPYQIKDALTRSDVQISRCEIDIFDNDAGKDLVVFNLFTKDQISEKQPGFAQLLKNMSIDFNDVVHHNIVDIKVNLVHVEKNCYWAETKTYH